MDTYHLKPENMRAPNHLTKEEIEKSLDELDNKIKILRARVNATAADSNHTYHEHIAALETKRGLIADKLTTSGDDNTGWGNLRSGLDDLHRDADNLNK